MANTEDIEARLCAYVDGELDAAGRAEIERHLATNPQHRRLIDELMQQRDLLRALPRARAPRDVAETIHAQLERSALLSEDDWHEPIRISRWPQVRAAAAVLLLVFGLAAVVYYVIPSPNQPSAEMAVNRMLSEAPLAAEGELAPTTGPTGSVTVSRGEPDYEVVNLTEQQHRLKLALGQISERQDVMSNAIAPGSQIVADMLGSPARRTPGTSGAAAVTVVVDAADPFAAQQQVVEYLRNRGVEPQVSQAPMPQPLALDPAQMFYGSRHQATRLQLPDPDRRAAAPMPDIAAQASPAAKARSANGLARSDVDRSFKERTAGEAESGVALLDVVQPQDQSDLGDVKLRVDKQGSSGGAGYEMPQEQAYFARLKRGDVDLLCQTLSDSRLGQVSQHIDPVTDEPSTPRMPHPLEPMRISVGDWSDLFRTTVEAHEAQLAFIAPATQPGVEESVDVLIVIRPDTSSQAQSPAPGVADEPADLDEPADAADPTAPATAPAAP